MSTPNVSDFSAISSFVHNPERERPSERCHERLTNRGNKMNEQDQAEPTTMRAKRSNDLRSIVQSFSLGKDERSATVGLPRARLDELATDITALA